MRFAPLFLLCVYALSLPGQAPLPDRPAEDKPLANPPLAPSPTQQASRIETARESALRYTESLPDFLCTQRVSRYTGPAKGVPKLHDTLEMAVAYTAGGEQYRLLKINGRPTTRTLAAAGGFQSHGEFGTMLRSIFRPEAAAVFRWQRWASLRGKPVHVYSFEVPQAGSNYHINWTTRRRQYHMTAAFRGLLFLDADSSQILRIVTEAIGIPDDWPLRQNSSTLDYGYVEIAGKQFLLPRSIDSWVLTTTGQQRNVSDFSHYRHFSGDAVLSFGGDAVETPHTTATPPD